MALTEMIVSALSFVYLALILETIFSSVKNVMYKQRAFEGRLLFLLYSLFVYYKNISINIFFWDKLLNEPIIKAYQIMDAFLQGIGLSMANDPLFIFKYLIPLGFAYYFVEYWFQYGFGDKRIARMVSIAGVVILLSSNYMGLLSAATPLGGIPFGNAILGVAMNFFPTGDLTGSVLVAPDTPFKNIFTTVLGPGLGASIDKIVSGIARSAFFYLVIALLAILFYLMGKYIITQVAGETFLSKGGIIYFLLFSGGFSLLSLVSMSFMLYMSPWNSMIFDKMLAVFIFLIAINVLALLSELLVFAAIYGMVRNFKTALNLND